MTKTGASPVQVIRVAITVQLVPWLGSWVTDGSPWRVRQLGCPARLELESLNVRVHDLDLLPSGRPDNRRIEIIVDGLFHGAQLG